jgi:Nucleotidyl transferase AbiEii toxin, Type IV TA system
MTFSLQRGFCTGRGYANANERLLYRLERSAAGERFILKGAMLFVLWSKTLHRATKDVDLLCRGDNSIAEIEAIFRSVCEVDVVPDGLEFNPATCKI